MRVPRGIARALAERLPRRARRPAFGLLSFRCNVCGAACEIEAAALRREEPSCSRCLSTVRMRAVIDLLSMTIHGESLALPDFPVRKEIRGLGLSDWAGYAEKLAEKFDYTNTYYDREPRLDIRDVDPALHGTADFLIASDVFEHVSPPVSAAFSNARKLLKQNGVMIFTVPYTKGDRQDVVEHFPNLHSFEIVKRHGEYVLVNTTADGRVEEFRNLAFHGGAGLTLEMRVFSEGALLEQFERAGFGEVTIYKRPNFTHGIYWSDDWSLPMSARARG